MTRVLHVSTFDKGGGAANAAFRLHQGLRSRGVDSKILVQTKIGNDPEVIERDSSLARWFGRRRPFLDFLPLALYRRRRVMHWSVEWVPAGVARQVSGLKPDIVHLQWICRGFVPLSALGGIAGKVVWTLHDSWPFTGGCHVPGECRRYERRCGSCPLLGSRREYDLSRRIWSRKHRYYRQADLTIVTPSRWLAECASQSSLFRNRRIEVIPNGIDTGVFRPGEKRLAREELGLPQDRRLILFGAMNAFDDRNKGFHLLAEAMDLLMDRWRGDEVELILFGADAPPSPLSITSRMRFMGVVDEEPSMVSLYSAADVVVVPSLQENLPNTVMEAMACGTPVVAFRAGGIPDMIDHMKNGYLADPASPEGLAEGLEYVLSDETRRDSLSRAARERICSRFDVSSTSALYEDLYGDLLAGRGR